MKETRRDKTRRAGGLLVVKQKGQAVPDVRARLLLCHLAFVRLRRRAPRDLAGSLRGLRGPAPVISIRRLSHSPIIGRMPPPGSADNLNLA